MSTQINGVASSKTKPGNYLSLDGGPSGFSGVPSLSILNEMLSRLQWDLELDEIPLPCRYFDLFIGTGTGAIVAILLGRMQMPLPEAIDVYSRLAVILAVRPAQDDKERKRNSDAFKEAFTQVLLDANFSAETPMLDENAPKTAICTLRATSSGTPYVIRSYRSRGSQTTDFTILEAACACIAAPDRFLPLVHGIDDKRLDLTSALLGYANPMQELLREAMGIFGDAAYVATITSIGTGKMRLVDLRDSSSEQMKVDALKQIIASCEQVHRDMQIRLNNTRIYSRFNLDRELGQDDDIQAVTSAYLEDEETSTKLDDTMTGIRRRRALITIGELSSVSAVKIVLKPRPSVTPHFVGRDDILDKLRETHFSEHPHQGPAISVLSGLGGSGKTQTALKFALEFETRLPEVPIYFLDASSEPRLKAELEIMIRSMETLNQSPSYKDAIAWLVNQQKDWLVILNNADDFLFDIFQYIPKSSHGHIIITTRNGTYASLAPNNSYHVEGLPLAEAASLLLKISCNPDKDNNRAYAEKIVAAIDCLPLAITHAAAYIGVHHCLPTYLDVYNDSKGELLAAKSNAIPEDSRTPVSTIIQTSLDRLSPAARDVMILFAQLDTTSISHDIIAKSAERQFLTIDEQPEDEPSAEQTIKHAKILMDIFCPGGQWNEFEFNQVVQQCVQSSLLRITIEGEARSYSMLSLVQTYLKSHSKRVQGHSPNRLIIRLLGSSISIDYDYAHLSFNRLLVPQLRLIEVDHVVEPGDHYAIASVMREQGNPLLASRHLERCLEMRKTTLDEDDRDTNSTMAELAVCYTDLGRFQDAANLEEKVVEMYKQMLGEEHSDTVRAMGNLAASYGNLGRHQDALDLEEKVLEMRKRLSGDKHLDTMRAMGNLAMSLQCLERYKDAVELEKKVLELMKKHLGKEHPDTAGAIANLALSYHKMTKFQEALEMEEQVLQNFKKIWGLEHPYTLLQMRNHSSTLEKLDMKEQRLALLQEALPLYEVTYGDGHSFTMEIREQLASVKEGHDQAV